MRILLTAARGLIGSAVSAGLLADGHDVVPLVRGRAGPANRWDPGSGVLDPAVVAGYDAVIHLSGEPILGRWTAAKRRAIRASRVDSTALLARTLASLARPPASLLVASAVGIYGDRGEALLTEQSAPGADWLAGVTREWEAAAEPAARMGVRVVHLRTGLVLSRSGGALAGMLPPFRLGLGGPVGNGGQYWSWIAIDDVVGAVRHILADPGIEGPVNLTAPGAVTSREFARTLGRVLHRPAFLPLPAPVLRLVFGAAAATLLSGSRARPAKLIAAGYAFSYPSLEPALRRLLD